MANYNGKTRTNHFKVQDVQKLKDFADANGYELFKNDDNYFVLGGFNASVIEDLDTDELKEFQDNLEDSQVVISMEIGNETLRYLSAFSSIISKDKIETIDLFAFALDVFSKEITDEKNKEISY